MEPRQIENPGPRGCAIPGPDTFETRQKQHEDNRRCSRPQWPAAAAVRCRFAENSTTLLHQQAAQIASRFRVSMPHALLIAERCYLKEAGR